MKIKTLAIVVLSGSVPQFRSGSGRYYDGKWWDRSL